MSALNAHLPRLPIRLRLVVWYALFLAVTIIAVGLFLLASMEGSLQREIDEALRLRASQIEREVAADGPERLAPGQVAAVLLALTSAEEFAAPGIYVQVVDQQGLLLAYSPNLPGGQLPANPQIEIEALAGHEAYATVPAGHDRVRVLARPVQSGERVIGAVLVGESMHLHDIALRNMQRLLILATGGAVLAALLGSWWLTGRALGPIAEMTRVARRIAATGQFEQRISVPAVQDELGELAATFNDMLARLEKTFRRQQEFLADASHELRGPLMVIRGNLDLLKLDLPREERIESVREAVEEVDRMARLVSNLLFLAEVDAQEVVQHAPVRLHEVVTEVLEQARTVDGGAHEVILARHDSATVLGDRDRLDQLLSNLVENALRYTPTGGCVTLSLRNHGSVVELAVSDTGIGIQPEHLARIFERFYRVDKARSRGQGGSGLGLAIVKQVADAHGGQVRVRSKPGEGSIFTVVLPTLQQNSPNC
ncbi:MAG: HAMP domain-containing protein [Chloroflexota bacterium]|nr:MAG: HAMP domain-containing protein [Chloroflexota bacterium]